MPVLRRRVRELRGGPRPWARSCRSTPTSGSCRRWSRGAAGRRGPGRASARESCRPTGRCASRKSRRPAFGSGPSRPPARSLSRASRRIIDGDREHPARMEPRDLVDQGGRVAVRRHPRCLEQPGCRSAGRGRGRSRGRRRGRRPTAPGCPTDGAAAEQRREEPAARPSRWSSGPMIVPGWTVTRGSPAASSSRPTISASTLLRRYGSVQPCSPGAVSGMSSSTAIGREREDDERADVDDLGRPGVAGRLEDGPGQRRVVRQDGLVGSIVASRSRRPGRARPCPARAARHRVRVGRIPADDLDPVRRRPGRSRRVPGRGR